MATVLSIAYPFAPVGRDAVGGAEQILAACDAALVGAGHRSLVLACAGSTVAGTLLPVPRLGSLDDDNRSKVQAMVRMMAAEVAADVIHAHGIDFAECLPPPRLPTLVTLHLPPDWYPSLRPRPRTHHVCVSAGQHRACPAGLRASVVANGVPVASLAAARHARRGFALMLGRVCPEKGQHLALQAAHAAGVPLLLGGEVFGYPAHRDYFERRVRPLLDRGRRFLGPVGFARKRRLLAAARCLLAPSLAAETSSLVAMEALACGTPVIAYPSGALSEIIEHGRTGFLVDSPDAMAAAIARAGDIDPQACRDAARERFDERRMVAEYLDLYDRLARCA